MTRGYKLIPCAVGHASVRQYYANAPERRKVHAPIRQYFAISIALCYLLIMMMDKRRRTIVMITKWIVERRILSTVQFSSVQSLDRFDRGGGGERERERRGAAGMREDSAEILFEFSLLEAMVSSSDMG